MTNTFSWDSLVQVTLIIFQGAGGRPSYRYSTDVTDLVIFGDFMFIGVTASTGSEKWMFDIFEPSRTNHLDWYLFVCPIFVGSSPQI